MISTSDNHLLMVGGTPPVNNSGKGMYVVKIEFSGDLTWENSYDFDPDKVKFGDNFGRAVTEVNDGYIVGGGGNLSERNQGYGVPALTKIGFNGNKIWSKAATIELAGYNFRGLQSNAGGTRFVATGILPDADFIVYDAQNADTVQIINSTENDDHLLNLARVGDIYFAPGSNNNRLDLFDVSENSASIYENQYDDFERQYSHNIDGFENFTITTGHTSDGSFGNPILDLYAVKNASDLSTVWTFIYPKSDTGEEAVGAYELPNSVTGLVGNQYNGRQSTIILLQVDENGQLIPF